MNILDGKKTSKKIYENIKKEIVSLKYKRPPILKVILIGNDKPSEIYVKHKKKACEKVGIEFILYKYESNVSENFLIDLIKKFNSEDIDGILVQFPLPKHINENVIINEISPDKDVDGFHYLNVGKMTLGMDCFKPATPYGIINLLEEYNIDWTGKNITIVGRGKTVGLPLSILLGNNDTGTVTSCHINTKDLKKKTKKADIVISAVGKPNFITKSMVKKGSIVIDVGINKIESNKNKSGYKLVGDVDYKKVKSKCSYITPVPGGVGPMTVAGLLLNVMKSYKSNIQS